MKALSLPAFAKINLGLQVLESRRDGFHEIRTVFQTISLSDRLVFEPASKLALRIASPGRERATLPPPTHGARRARGRGTALPGWQALPTKTLVERQRSSEGLSVEGPPAGADNLVLRAARAFGRSAQRAARVRITLHKSIPIGAGLGGGSADAAVTLLALNGIHGHPLGPDRLQEIAAGLGSDVPFFLTGGTALGLGRGEIVRPLRDLEPAWIVLLAPVFGVSTAEAYRRVDALREKRCGRILTPRRGQISIYRFSGQWVRATRKAVPLANDLEHAVSPMHPSLRSLVRLLRAAGASAAAMTGSGSAVYGLFAAEGSARKGLRYLTGMPVAHAWLGRTVGAAEYSASLRF